jgi:hypothetical protein
MTPDFFLPWIESSALGRVIRDAGPWAYALVNLAHILGVASLFGAVLTLDLRLLGLWRRVPLGPLADAVVPIARGGFGLAAASGIALLATNATEYAGNPFLLVKFPAIAVGLVNAVVLGRSAAWRAKREGVERAGDRRRLALMGGVSLASWLTAISAGRLIGYW